MKEVTVEEKVCVPQSRQQVQHELWPDLRSAGGVTIKEIICLNHLVAAWNAFTELDARIMDDDAEFRRAIHAAQQLIAMRVARRADPHIWTQP